MVQKGALIICLILAVTHINSISGCLDYGSKLCSIIHSTRQGTIGHGRSCSDGLDRLIIQVGASNEMDHCKGGHPAAAMQNDVPPPPPPSDRGEKAAAVAALENADSQLTARILAALGLTQEAVAQNCNNGRERLCIYIQTWGQEQWYCSDQRDVSGLKVEFSGQIIRECN